MKLSLQQTLDQQRAAEAWKCVAGCLDDAKAALREQIQQLERELAQAPDDEKRRNRIQKHKQEIEKKLASLNEEKEAESWRKKYGSLARKVPMLIQTNGLGQTLAFLRAKGKDDPADAHNVLFEHLSRWTMSQVAPNAGSQNLLEWVLQTDSNNYRRATAEALAYLTWLKRFAEAELPTEEE